ncbi:uncharacterized protein LOC123545791 [Mercenaria mercenaria]|uniref:uncharacterized protein LOC123545791 n=1 Tax=Mercenaria mercenaria TaxID=6596 RepID=UPI00234EB4F6|nr:uncharacterized protein LOC123545791 [Mercenaria mercenaria]
MAYNKDNRDFKTPEVSKKRRISELISPSDGPQGDHVNSPNPTRRKELFSPDVTTESNVHPKDSLQGNDINMSDLVKSAICNKEVMEAISAALVPLLTVVFESMLRPINDKVDAQSKGLSSLNKKLDEQKQSVQEVREENRKVKMHLREAEERIDSLEKSLDDLEQYGRRTSLRFHRVPINSPDLHCSNDAAKLPVSNYSSDSTQPKQADRKNQLDTYQIVLNICNNKMNLKPPLSVEDIERSHTIGPVRDGYAQIIC